MSCLSAYAPSLDEDIVSRRLAQLLRQGEMRDHDLESRIRRLGDRFRLFATMFPPLPGRGAIMTPELRGECEKYLPLTEIIPAFRRLLALSFLPPHRPTVLLDGESWFELLDTFPRLPSCDPAWWLRRLAESAEFRTIFIFHLALPRRHGEAFRRYPGQLAFLERWLSGRSERRAVSFLDAACGTGEGTWEIARLLLKRGFTPARMLVRGETLAPPEAFAAAHGFFPHDGRRQEGYRREMAALIAAGAAAQVRFAAADILEGGEGEFDLILCNGLLGGPFLHDEERLRRAAEILTERLARGGLLAAADTFHTGWKKIVPPERIAALLREAGLEPLSTPEGVAATKPQ
jgi:chemotaxis methyl-accepting protein methylase